MAIGADVDPKKLLDQLSRAAGPIKAAVLCGIGLAVVGLYWVTLHGGVSKQRTVLERQLASVESQIAEARAVASNLSAFQEQRERLRRQLDEAIQQLPNSADLPVLLTDINSLGKKSGLEMHKFRPTGEVDRGFYAEVPIEVKFFGAYHDIGVFFDRVARLSRIVNVTSLNMKLSEYQGETPRLEVSGVATTFKFVDRASETAGGE